MPGTIYLGGGGSAEDEQLLWTEMLRDTPRVLYWPFALSGEMLLGADEWLRGILAKNWPDVLLTTWIDLVHHDPAELFAFDLIFIGGGNTYDLLNHVVEQQFITPIRDFVATGGSLYGGSAGAILTADSIDSAAAYDQNKTDLKDFSGLKLVTGVMVLPHYSDQELHVALKLNLHHEKPVLGIPETSGIVVKAGSAVVVGRDAAYVIDRTGIRSLPPGSHVEEVALAL
jgi:dipeptidase E